LRSGFLNRRATMKPSEGVCSALHQRRRWLAVRCSSDADASLAG
jgi:hypothetical protein